MRTLLKMPEAAAYRRHTENIIRERADIVMKVSAAHTASRTKDSNLRFSVECTAGPRQSAHTKEFTKKYALSKIVT